MANKYVTVAGAGAANGTSWANAWAMAAFVADAEGSAAAGDRYYIEQGTYTIGEAFDMSTQDGTGPLPIWIIGVKTGTTNEPPVVGDHATGDNRPLFAMEANAFTMAEYWKMYNIRFTGSHNSGVFVDDYDVLFNVKTSHSGNFGLNLGGNFDIAVACEATGSITAVSAGASTQLTGCYLHDVTNGVNITSNNVRVDHCIIDTCSGNGIAINERSHTSIVNNTIYNCGIGIYATIAVNCTIVNNILDANTVGIEWTTETHANFIDFNCWNNTDDIQDTDVEKGFYPVNADPGMTNPAGGDFSVQSGDPVNDAGVDAGQFTGATV